MPQRWVRRRSHTRRTRTGKLVFVRANWALRQSPLPAVTSKIRRCPHCGAQIIVARMPNGGLAHFEGRPGLRGIKHPCMHRGDRLSRARDNVTPDLFEDYLDASKFLEG